MNFQEITISKPLTKATWKLVTTENGVGAKAKVEELTAECAFNQ